MGERNVLCQFWLSEDEADSFNDIVEKSGLSRSAYLRCLIRRLVPVELPPPDYYVFARELHAIGNNLNQIAQKAHVLGAIDVRRYEASVQALEQVTTKIAQAVFRHKELDRWQPPRSGE